MKRLSPVSPQTFRLFALTLTLLITVYMLVIGGAFDAAVRFRVQLLNTMLAGGLAILWLVIRWQRRMVVSATGLEWPLVALALGQWLATATSAQSRLSAEAALSLTAWIIAFIILCAEVSSGWPRTYVINALLLIAILVAAQAAWEVVAWYQLWLRLGQWPPVSFRLTGFLGHPNLTTAVINLLLPFVIVQASLRPKAIERGGWALVGVGLLAAEFFTSSRAGWIAGGVTLGLTLAFLAWERRTAFQLGWTRWQRWPIVWRIGAGGFVILVLSLAAGLLVRQSQHVSHGGNLIDSRRYIWLPAWQVFTEQPLLGRGPDLYAWWYSRFDSVPPIEILPHPHSLPLYLLSGSGLVGTGAALSILIVAVLQLRRRWPASPLRIWLMAGVISLIGALVHNFFDYFFTSALFIFVFMTIAALTFAPEPVSPPSSPKGYSPLWVAGPLIGILGFAIFSLRATAQHEQGLQLAEQGRWSEAAVAFQSAAEADPGLTLYWAEAAFAFTRAEKIDQALPLWQRAHRDYPDWTVWDATLALLQNNTETMKTLTQTEARSEFVALNAGALAETQGETQAARAAYEQALARNPVLAEALFWKQTALRTTTLAEWQATQSPDTSALTAGWAAFNTSDNQRAITLFEQARLDLPLSNEPYLGLARAYWAAGDEAQAERYLRLGENLPVAYLWQKLDFWILRGDWAAAHNDRAAAIEAYAVVFSALDDYGSSGPGTYGYPKPYYLIFHRATLPSDLIPQFVHADITAELDGRFAQLARWYAEDHDVRTACIILSRVAREAPDSESGTLRQTLCP